MNIVWHGHSFFRISIQKDKNGSVEIALDPFKGDEGIKPPKIKSDILLSTDSGSSPSSFKNIDGDPFFISSPGEYEVKGAFIQGIRQNNAGVFYTIEGEELNVCHLGGFNQKELSSEQLEAIGRVDILMIPVGGGDILGPKEAAHVVSQIEPAIVIPMNYKVQGIKKKLAGAEDFLKVMGISTEEKLGKLSVKRKDISSEKETRVVILECKK